jgi:hypothetical protein
MSDIVPTEIPLPEVKKDKLGRPNKNIGRKPTEAQMAGLRKGFDMMKAKRAANEIVKAQKLKEKEERKAAGIPEPEPEPKLKKVIELPPLEIVEPVVKERKGRADKGVPRKEKPHRTITREEFDEIRDLIKANTKPIEKITEVEKIVERHVPGPITERVVEKKLTGSELLNSIFFK